MVIHEPNIDNILTESYNSDSDYPYGTLIQIDNNNITIAKTDVDGVVADNLINSTSNHALAIISEGQSKVKVERPINKYDNLYLSKNLPGYASRIPNGKPFGKALEDDRLGYVLANLSTKH